jgi:hypothetical protein
MQPTGNQILSTRRGFLARLAGLATGAGLLAAKPAETQAEPAAEKPEKPEPSGYRETEHVRAYYRSVRD